MSEDWRPCRSFCSHGEVCELSAGHEMPHDSRYCQWTDEQAVSKAEADAILRTKPGGNAAADLFDLADALLGDDDE